MQTLETRTSGAAAVVFFNYIFSFVIGEHDAPLALLTPPFGLPRPGGAPSPSPLTGALVVALALPAQPATDLPASLPPMQASPSCPCCAACGGACLCSSLAGMSQ
jgi:hypothetical protein